ncbi:MAG: DUF2846 domain-containing protein [Methylococcales symbiont of Hymedesmia sp. n. MRB-2018]|nr:MAG: DUF2846 domain-containing protein [Methylococcales symbiont of Hymedesmia sp. n. MRB-2018]
MRILIIFLTLMALVGCANVGAKFNVAEIEIAGATNAIVYFYRPSRFQGSAITMPVIANKIEIGTLDNGAYFKKIISPGVYKIHSGTSAIDRISTFSFEAGKTYFVRCFLDMGMWVSSVRFVQVHKDEAIQEIKKTALQL